MRTLAISHQRDAGPGIFAEAIETARGELDLWHIAETADPPADPFGYDAVMTFGGSMHADQDGEHAWIAPEKALLADLLEAGVPVLGVCLGSQLPRRGRRWPGAACARAGDRLARGPGDRARRSVGRAARAGFEAFQWHSFECVPPPSAEVLATSAVCVQAYRLADAAWGIQFHAEVEAVDAHWIDDYHDGPTRSASASTPPSSVRTPPRGPRPGTSSAGHSVAGSSPRRSADSPVSTGAATHGARPIGNPPSARGPRYLADERADSEPGRIGDRVGVVWMVVGASAIAVSVLTVLGVVLGVRRAWRLPSFSAGARDRFSTLTSPGRDRRPRARRRP